MKTKCNICGCEFLVDTEKCKACKKSLNKTKDIDWLIEKLMENKSRVLNAEIYWMTTDKLEKLVEEMKNENKN